MINTRLKQPLCNVIESYLSNTKDEIWRPVPVKPFNQNYEISNLSRVRSKPHAVRQQYRNSYQTHYYRGHLLKQDISTGTSNHPKKNNLLARRVTMTFHGKRGRFQVHRLVAKAFLLNLHHYPIINHKDRDESHNKVSNLEWCNKSYNNTYAGAMIRTADGESKPCCLIKNNTEYEFLSIPQAANYVYCTLHMGKTLPNVERSIARVCRGARKHAYGFRASYLKEV